jgi:hypothetical protein
MERKIAYGQLFQVKGLKEKKDFPLGGKNGSSNYVPLKIR